MHNPLLPSFLSALVHRVPLEIYRPKPGARVFARSGPSTLKFYTTETDSGSASKIALLRPSPTVGEPAKDPSKRGIHRHFTVNINAETPGFGWLRSTCWCAYRHFTVYLNAKAQKRKNAKVGIRVVEVNLLVCLSSLHGLSQRKDAKTQRSGFGWLRSTCWCAYRLTILRSDPVLENQPSLFGPYATPKNLCGFAALR